MTKKNNERAYLMWILFAVLIFGIMMIFYISVEPIMVCDPDDWTYISYIRRPWPIWKDWNPAKVFPETFMGMLGYFAAYVIYPITKDYILSFTYVYAIVISIFIMLYIFTIAELLKKMLCLSNIQSMALAFIAFLMHFIILLSEDVNNMFMFTASNLNCYMNYLIPTLLCFILVVTFFLRFLECPENLWWKGSISKNKYNYFKLGCLMVLLYLAVFSNMVCNIVLLSPLIYMFLSNFFCQIKKEGGRSLFSFRTVKRYILFEYVFVLEIICLFFEYNGGRANDLEFTFVSAVSNIWTDICYVINHINEVAIVFCFFTLISAVFFYFYKIKKIPVHKSDKDNIFIKAMLLILFSFVLCSVYIVLLYIRIGQNKLRRSENVFIIYIFFGLAVIVAFGYLLKNLYLGWIIVPFCFYIMVVITMSGDYKPSIPFYNGDVRLCYAVDQYIIKQYQVADQQGLSEFNLILPDSGLGDYSFSADRISQTLYNHGIVSKKMTTQQILIDSNSFYQNIWEISMNN